MTKRLLIVFSILQLVSSLHAQKSDPRAGWIFGAAAGGSSLTLKSGLIGVSTTGAASFPNMKIGYMLGSRTAALVSLPGTVYRYGWSGRERDRGFEGIIPSIQYWVKPRWWVSGGAGLAMDAPAFYDIKDETERKFYFGAGGIASTGFELWKKKRFALDIQARWHTGYVNAPEGRRTGSAFSLMLGVNWY